MVLLVSFPKTTTFKLVRKPDTHVRCAQNFQRIYNDMFGENCATSEHVEARRKWKVLRAMTKSEILQDYKPDKDLGKYLHSRDSKQDLLRILKNNNGIVRDWIWLKE